MGILRDIFDRAGVSGDVLVAADSTIAYSVDKRGHASWNTMRQRLERECPSVTSVWFCAYPGATIDGLAKYAETSHSGRGETYDYAVVVAGWNSNGVPDFEMGRHLARLQGAISQRIRRARGWRSICGIIEEERGAMGSRDLGEIDSEEGFDKI